MKRSRTKCPDTFTAELMVGILDDLEDHLSPFVSRAFDGGDVFRYNYSIKPYDKDAIQSHKPLIKKLLLACPTGIIKKSVVFIMIF